MSTQRISVAPQLHRYIKHHGQWSLPHGGSCGTAGQSSIALSWQTACDLLWRDKQSLHWAYQPGMKPPFQPLLLAAGGWMPPRSTTVPFCGTAWLCLHSVVMDTSRAQKRASFKLLLLPRRELWDSLECVCRWIIMMPIWSACPLALNFFFFTSAAHVCIVPVFVTPLVPCTYSAVDGEQESLTKSDGSAPSSPFSWHCEPCIPLCLSESQCMTMKPCVPSFIEFWHPRFYTGDKKRGGSVTRLHARLVPAKIPCSWMLSRDVRNFDVCYWAVNVLLVKIGEISKQVWEQCFVRHHSHSPCFLLTSLWVLCRGVHGELINRIKQRFRTLFGPFPRCIHHITAVSQ